MQGPAQSKSSAEALAILRMRRGHEAAALRQQELVRAEGPHPKQAIAEALAALDALAENGQWPAPRDAQSEREVERVRDRWVKIEQHARANAIR